MKYVIKHDIRGRMRIHVLQKRMTDQQADTLQYYLESRPFVRSVKVQERLGDAVIRYEGSREELLKILNSFQYGKANVPSDYFMNSGRKMNREYWDKLVFHVVKRGFQNVFFPTALRNLAAAGKSVKYLWHGMRILAKGRLEVPVLDAVAIGVSVARADFKTAGSVMFLLRVGEILEEWTHKKTVSDLAKSMSLNTSHVWLWNGEQEVQVSISDIKPGDMIKVHMGNIIPFDGEVADGEGMVNQASLTGESLPVEKLRGTSVYAGTVLEEGEITLRVRDGIGNSRFEKIVTMIEDTQKLKSSVEGKAEHMADRLVPYTLAGTVLTWLLTRNTTKALSVLMVDFSCALKLAMPISVLSAIREARNHQITVKGGKYLEAMAEADTIVFDKTGTLTKAQPKVAGLIPFMEKEPDELLRFAACLEEHFPHSMAKAVVEAAKEKNLEHEELHTKVEYLVAHGISSTISGKRVVIGSYHFVFEDEKCRIREQYQEIFDTLDTQYSHLYMAIDGYLAAVIYIHDPLREEAKDVISALRRSGIKKLVMMTGDSARTAEAIAEQVGVDEYYAEVLPEDKAGFVEKEKAKGRKVAMTGDGINDSPALSVSDVGIAIGDGAELAREISDVMIDADDLYSIVVLKIISDRLMKKINGNYKKIIAFNSGLLLLGIGGIIQPTISAMLHNASTLAISLKSMEDLL